jgi:nitrous oxidase accessory protein
MRLKYILILILLANAVSAEVVTVGSIGWEYKSIQAAVEAAKPGDTIEVHNGTYYENVNVYKQLTLLGLGSPVVDAGGKYENGPAISLFADGVVLEGFTAVNSTNTAGDAFAGGGICVHSNSSVIKGNTVRDNYLCGIKLSPYHWGNVTTGASNNTISGNNISQNNEGICLLESNNNTIEGNNIVDNFDSGILLEYLSSNNMIEGNNLCNNSIGIRIYINGSDNNTFWLNNLDNNTIYNVEDISANKWDNETFGNYYSDFSCKDEDGNGICDSERRIPGDGQNVDRYPLATPFTSAAGDIARYSAHASFAGAR